MAKRHIPLRHGLSKDQSRVRARSEMGKGQWFPSLKKLNSRIVDTVSDSVEERNKNKSPQARYIEITCEVGQEDIKVQTKAMIDSGATSCFIDKDFCRNMGFTLIQKRKPITVQVIDGREISSGAITHEARLRLITADRTEEAIFDVTRLGHNSLVLGLP